MLNGNRLTGSFMTTITRILFCAVLCLCVRGLAANLTMNTNNPAPTAATAPSPRNLHVPEAAKLLKENKAVIVLDVRTPEEFLAGHIAGATNINFQDATFQAKLRELDATKPYLVHCAAGGRSAKARDLMVKMNFKDIYHLEGGIVAWQKAGLPVTK